jgi:hypothetical protein
MYINQIHFDRPIYGKRRLRCTCGWEGKLYDEDIVNDRNSREHQLEMEEMMSHTEECYCLFTADGFRVNARIGSGSNVQYFKPIKD